MTVTDFELDAKYRQTEGTILLTGIQALIRITIDQHRADAAPRPAHGHVHLGIPGLATRHARPDDQAHAAAARRARRSVAAGHQRGPGRHRGVGEPATSARSPCPTRRRPRHVVRQGSRASIAAATCSSTPTSWASRTTAACSPSAGTIRAPSPRRCRRTPTRPFTTRSCRSSIPARSRRCWISASTATRCPATPVCGSGSRS